MQILIVVLTILVAVTGLLWFFVAANPASIARILRSLTAFVAILAAVFFALVGRWAFALIAAGVGFYLIWAGSRAGGLLGGSASAGNSRGNYSTVRSAALEMELDHDSGDMDGLVLTGRFEGQRLSDLADEQLLSLLAEVAADSDSVALLEAYLDRRLPGWREDFDGDTDAGAGGTPHSGAMSIDEAYEILGLTPGASEAAVHEAHRRLIKSVHPDQGGSSFLAAKINQAKDRILSSHRS